MKSKLIKFLLIAIVIVIIIYLISTNTDRKNIAFLESYGWEVDGKQLKGKYDLKEHIAAKIKLVQDNSDYENLTLRLSEIGLTLEDKNIEKLTIYSYYLKQHSANERLLAYVWVSSGEIIFSYIGHLEVHTRLYYWPVNYDYEQIKKDLVNLKADYAK